MRIYTLCFLIKRSVAAEITHVCLAMKKRGLGVGKWNGAGGKVDQDSGETVEAALLREVNEEIGVTLKSYEKVAVLEFVMPASTTAGGIGHAFFSEDWEGEPSESEEMRPQWFAVEDIPYQEMWGDDIHWLPKVLAGNKLKGTFEFDANDQLTKHSLEVLASEAQLD